MKVRGILLLLVILCLTCGKSGPDHHQTVLSLSRVAPRHIAAGDFPVVTPDNLWIDPEQEGKFFLQDTASLWFHIPDDPKRDLSVRVSTVSRVDLTFSLEDHLLKVKGRSVQIPPSMLKSGTCRLYVRTSSRTEVKQITIRWGDKERILKPISSGEDTPLYINLFEFLRQRTLPIGRDHYPGFLFHGSTDLTIPIEPARKMKKLQSHFYTFRGENTEARITLETSAGPVTRSIALPGKRKAVAFNVDLPEPVLLSSIHISLTTSSMHDYVFWAAPRCLSPATSKPLNVILITVDTTRQDVLGCYGKDPSPTPHFDALASSSQVFTRAKAPTPWTLPSHASLFTGRLPGDHGAGVWSTHLIRGVPTLAELFSRKGFATAGFSGGELTKGKFGLCRGFDFYRDPWHFERRADDLTKDAVQFISNHHGIPFFVFINYFDPHAPYDSPDRNKSAYNIPDLLLKRSPDDPLWKLAHGYPEVWKKWMNGEYARTDEALELTRRLYTAEVNFMDQAFGRLVSFLKNNGLYNRTIIVVAGDHGEFLGEHDLLTHTTRLYEPVLKIPLIIHLPSVSPPKRIERPVVLQDIFPTLVRLCNLEEVPLTDAVDLFSSEDTRRYLFAEEHEFLPVHPLIPWMKSSSDLYAFYFRDKKVILNRGMEAEVYDLEKDPTESQNLASEYGDLLEKVRAIVDRYENSWVEKEGTQTYQLSPEERKALQALGYLQ